MRWAKLIQYRSEVEIEGKAYHLLAEKQGDEDFAISLDGEYICDVANLPEREDVEQIISYELEISRRTNEGFFITK